MLREVTSDEFGQAFMSGINANTDSARAERQAGDSGNP